MEKQTVFIKRYPSNGELPKEPGEYDTNLGRLEYFANQKAWRFLYKPEYWLEEIELPSEDNLPTNVALRHNTMYHDNNLQEAWNEGVIMCYDFILNHLKSNTNG